MEHSYSKTIKLKTGKEVILRIPQISDAKALADYMNELVDEDTFISSRKQTIEDEEAYIRSMLKKTIQIKKFIYLVW